jgi:cytochrome oxidase Cu insertion factor (SCO1/SenC/PrrC family)
MRDSRRGWLLVSVAGLVLAGGVWWGLGRGTDGEIAFGPHDGFDLPGVESDRLAVGDVAPDFTLMSYRGEPVTLSEFRGEKVVLLVFYRGHW